MRIWYPTELHEAIDVAREHLNWCQQNRGQGQYLNFREVVHTIGRDMRPRNSEYGRAVVIAILAAEWLQLRKNND